MIRDGDGRGAAARGPDRRSGAAPARPSTLLLGHRGADGRIDLLVARRRAAAAARRCCCSRSRPRSRCRRSARRRSPTCPNDGDAGLLQTTVENLLGVQVAKTVVLDDARAERRAAPPRRRSRSTCTARSQFDGQRRRRSFRPGRTHAPTGQARAAARRARSPAASSTGSSPCRTCSTGGCGACATPRSRGATLDGATRARARWSPRRRSRTGGRTRLPVESVATGGGERFEARVADVAALRRRPRSRTRGSTSAASRPRVEILNGTGAVGLAQAIAARGRPGRRSGHADRQRARTSAWPNTQVVYYRDRGPGGRPAHAATRSAAGR